MVWCTAGSFTPTWEPGVRRSQVSITTGLYEREGGGGGRVMRDKRIFSGLPQRGRAAGAGEEGSGGEIFLPMMHGSDNVPAWTQPGADAVSVCTYSRVPE